MNLHVLLESKKQTNKNKQLTRKRGSVTAFAPCGMRDEMYKSRTHAQDCQVELQDWKKRHQRKEMLGRAFH